MLSTEHYNSNPRQKIIKQFVQNQFLYNRILIFISSIQEFPNNPILCQGVRYLLKITIGTKKQRKTHDVLICCWIQQYPSTLIQEALLNAPNELSLLDMSSNKENLLFFYYFVYKRILNQSNILSEYMLSTKHHNSNQKKKIKIMNQFVPNCFLVRQISQRYEFFYNRKEMFSRAKRIVLLIILCIQEFSIFCQSICYLQNTTRKKKKLMMYQFVAGSSNIPRRQYMQLYQRGWLPRLLFRKSERL
eukprot:TRINITY_DN5849_c0_g3_i3.p1 TRINITY_DN5849_c0_g3~~TRINITY_DN5849_c0_g3_i3.p1  ORF type:complete len:246 (+),score=-15.40 TRINITY_DN5849_c0_g3_i3:157-894(+)